MSIQQESAKKKKKKPEILINDDTIFIYKKISIELLRNRFFYFVSLKGTEISLQFTCNDKKTLNRLLHLLFHIIFFRTVWDEIQVDENYEIGFRKRMCAKALYL